MVMNIVIVGFMGTGKTAVASRLAVRTGMKYTSMDRIIEEIEERSINEIFASEGEAYFRSVEKDVVREVSSQDGLIVDSGGGVVLDEDNIKALKKNGKIICLTATPEVIHTRTKKSGHRPLLSVPDPKGKIAELLESRAVHYEKADFQVDTSTKTVEQVVDEVIGLSGI